MRMVNQNKTKGENMKPKYIHTGSDKLVSLVEKEYKLDANKLNETPLCDIFGYLMATQGITCNVDRVYMVEKLYSLKNTSKVFANSIEDILHDIIAYGDISEFQKHLTYNKFEFVDTDGVVHQVQDCSWI